VLVALGRPDVDELPLDVLTQRREALEAHLKLRCARSRSGVSRETRSGRAAWWRGRAWKSEKNLEGLLSTDTFVTLIIAIVTEVG